LDGHYGNSSPVDGATRPVALRRPAMALAPVASEVGRAVAPLSRRSNERLLMFVDTGIERCARFDLKALSFGALYGSPAQAADERLAAPRDDCWGASMFGKEQAMTTSNGSRIARGALLPAFVAAMATALAACGGGGVIAVPDSGGGGGGTGVTASPYTLFASNYVAYATQAPSGAFLHSVQNGDLHTGFGGNLGYGCFSFNQTQMDSDQFYAVQAQANSNGGPPNGSNCQPLSSALPNTANDFAEIAIFPPGTNSSTSSIPTFDISQSSAMLIQMGNIYTQGDVPGAIGGNATVFTVDLSNDTSILQDGSGETALCAHDQTLTTVGRGAVSPLGVLNYVIPFSAFTCSKGSMATMQATGFVRLRVRITGDKNPNLKVNELDVIAVGYVGFTK
jgi:hypothetical protein